MQSRVQAMECLSDARRQFGSCSRCCAYGSEAVRIGDCEQADVYLLRNLIGSAVDAALRSLVRVRHVRKYVLRKLDLKQWPLTGFSDELCVYL
ncbi:hypothetical protein KP509_04G062900 [Ceratopteris richardii]|uniref:Uncharacterized protein n=1 Tax=Ceratopteris richardii TaxID=49495 RepID=A0A8T2UZT9_CERRI|nr:hypothetical protein KP509_04G062900 [Ceratopteris richardii]